MLENPAPTSVVVPPLSWSLCPEVLADNLTQTAPPVHARADVITDQHTIRFKAPLLLSLTVSLIGVER